MENMKKASNIKNQSVLNKDDRKASQGYVDLKLKSKEELEELIERQNKLLLNRFFIQKLPDKGQKIISFKTQLENEIKKRQAEYDSTCNLFNKLSLNDPEEIEWNQGNLNGSEKCRKQLDSDEEGDEDGEIDPLKLIATHSGTAGGSKIFYRKSGDLSNAEKLFYADKFCQKYGSVHNVKERFKPNQLKNNEKDQFVKSAENVKRKLGEKWEVTQATPPVPVFKDTKLISLSESLQLQKEQAEKLKEIEKKQATERLLQNVRVKMADKLPVTNLAQYRTTSAHNFAESGEEDNEESCSESENEEKENNYCFAVGKEDS